MLTPAAAGQWTGAVRLGGLGRRRLDGAGAGAAHGGANRTAPSPDGWEPPVVGSVYVASETALVRRHIADLVRAQGVGADFVTLAGASHPVAGDKVDSDTAGSASKVKKGGERFITLASLADDAAKADALFPYLEW